MQGYVVAKGDRFYAVIYEGLDPITGRERRRRLRTHHLESLYATLLASGRRDGNGGLDPKIVLEVHVILHKALRDACRRGLVVRNVAADAEAPKRRRPTGELRAWTAPQLQALLQVARRDRLFPAFWLAANTGMRRGELLGLRWGDIDTTGGHLSVNRSLIAVAYELHETRGKTRNSRRWIDLDGVTVDPLDRWRDALASELERGIADEDHVVCTSAGAPGASRSVHADLRSSRRDRAGPPPSLARSPPHPRDAGC